MTKSFAAKFRKETEADLTSITFFTTLSQLQRLMNKHLFTQWEAGWRPGEDFDLKLKFEILPKDSVKLKDEDNASV